MLDPRAFALEHSLSHLSPAILDIALGRARPRRKPGEDGALPVPVLPDHGPKPLSGGAEAVVD